MAGLGPSRALHSEHTGTAHYVRFPHLLSPLSNTLRTFAYICIDSANFRQNSPYPYICTQIYLDFSNWRYFREAAHFFTSRCIYSVITSGRFSCENSNFCQFPKNYFSFVSLCSHKYSNLHNTIKSCVFKK